MIVPFLLLTVFSSSTFFSLYTPYAAGMQTALIVNSQGSIIYVSSSLYTIFKNATKCYAINGTTGKIDYSGSDTAVIQSSINAIERRGGGTVHLQANSPGNYYSLTSPIDMVSNLIFEGEGWGTVLKYFGPPEHNAIPLSAYSCQNTIIRNFMLDGNKAQLVYTGADGYGVCGGIKLDKSDFCTIDNVYAYNIRGFGLYTWLSRDCTIQNCKVYAATDNGICIQAGSQGFSERCKIVNCDVSGCSNVGVSFVRAKDSEISGCYVYNNNGNDANQGYQSHESVTWEDENYNCNLIGNTIEGNPLANHAFSGTGNSIIGNTLSDIEINIPNDFIVANNTINNGVIRIWGDSNDVYNNSISESPKGGCGIIIDPSNYNKIHDNIITNALAAIQFEYPYSNYTDIENNKFVNCGNNGKPAIISGATWQSYGSFDYAIKTTVRANIGFITENSGIQHIVSSTSVTFNHGLAITPQIVHASFSPTVSKWTWTATSTQITITVTSSGTYTVNWDAEYS